MDSDNRDSNDAREGTSSATSEQSQEPIKKKKGVGGACCSAGFCSNRVGRDKVSKIPGRTFMCYFRFPKDPERRKKWLLRLDRDPKYFTPSDETRVCSDHFEDGDFNPKHVEKYNSTPEANRTKVHIWLLKDAAPNTDRASGKLIILF